MSCPTLQIPHHMNAPLLLLSSTHASNSALFSTQCSLMDSLYGKINLGPLLQVIQTEKETLN